MAVNKKTMVNVDIFDGHLLYSSWESPEHTDEGMLHDVIHPPTCPKVELYADPEVPGSGIMEHDCAVTFVLSNIGPDECFQAATTPGYRIVGWRHDVYRFSEGVEHDVVCFCLPELIDIPEQP